MNVITIRGILIFIWFNEEVFNWALIKEKIVTIDSIILFDLYQYILIISIIIIIIVEELL